MNRLHPELNRLFKAAHRVESISDQDCEVPSALILHVQRRMPFASNELSISLAEFMVQRCAALAAFVGVLTLTFQMAFAGSVMGILADISAPCALLFRLILP